MSPTFNFLFQIIHKIIYKYLLFDILFNRNNNVQVQLMYLFRLLNLELLEVTTGQETII